MDNELLKKRQDKLAKWKAKKIAPKKIKLGSLKRINKPIVNSKLKTVNTFDFEEQSKEEDDEAREQGSSIKKPRLDLSVDLDTLLTHMENQEPVKKVDSKALLQEIEFNEFNNNDSGEQQLYENNNDIKDDKDQINQLLQKSSAKTIPQHDISNYPIFKNLYQEHPFISSLSADEISELRKRDFITISGAKKRILRPILIWNHLGLPKQIQDVLTSMNFEEPTPIQCQSLPHLMNGEDFIGVAKTGSGKTLAFLLPLFRFLLANPLPPNKEYIGSTPRAIILTPTRELAIQISKTAQLFCDYMKLRVSCCYGGQQISSQIAELRHSSGVDIVIGTPGRIIDLLCANQGKILKLTHTGYLVIDEADRMFDLGFEPQINKLLKSANLRSDCQKVMFSATFPKKVEFLVKKILQNSIVCKVGEKNKVSEDVRQIIEVIGSKGQTKLEIENGKLSSLLKILGKWASNYYNKVGREELEHNKCIIFTERQDSADKLVKKLLSRGYISMALHGGKDQGERDGVISDFQNGVINILVATSVAARGLDVDGLDLVINFDSPNHAEDYIHRIGRTGRAGKKGTAITLLSIDEERYAWDLNYIIKQSKCLEGDIDSQLNELASHWNETNNVDKPKFSSGFGGKGLEKLQAIRENIAKTEKDVYLEGKNPPVTKTETTPDPNQDLIKVDYIVNSETKIGARLFEAHLTINDLPQNARWAVSKGEFLAQIEENTNVAISVRGQYFADPSAKGEKLYLMIESDDQNNVARAVAQLQRRILDSLQSN